MFHLYHQQSTDVGSLFQRSEIWLFYGMIQVTGNLCLPAINKILIFHLYLLTILVAQIKITIFELYIC